MITDKMSRFLCTAERQATVLLDSLCKEFKRIEENRNDLLRIRAARVVLGASVIRVFNKGSKSTITKALEQVNIDELMRIDNQDHYRYWFESELNKVARAIIRTNKDNDRIFPGYKWGHATKVLTLYNRRLVSSSRYFTDEQVEQISPLLYNPIDSVVIRRLKDLGYALPYTKIKEIDTPKKFYYVQELLGEAAAEVGVPRIWFDDVWGER